MIALIKRVGSWIAVAAVVVIGVLGHLWRRAVGRAEKAEAQRDAAQASAERERRVGDAREKVAADATHERSEIESVRDAKVAEIESRPRPAPGANADKILAEWNRRRGRGGK